ncbi:phenoloxidase-activating factor 1 [Trichonephila inaurata madagascariensis]|uniref:Phenoloxidase-activating factor 1 n=2 Tax=Trichonephila inaurata madagascariensis TaxID=2747483 RepID=A0A8X6X7N2_9ARAC|nr:phenoloxidase-activating factor 1 [Trichonephila inaurata madagascariensis]
MSKVWWGLFLVVLTVCAIGCQSQEDPPSDTRSASNDDVDYFEPGRATDDCLCVPLYLCVDGEIVDDGSNIIDPRKKPQTEELPLDEKYVPPECGPFHVCCRNPETSTIRPYEHRCGTRNPGGINGRILSAHANGEAEFGEWPWQAAILKNDNGEFIFKCGGTLIDDRHIITIAHCVDKFLDNKQSMVVRLGEWDTQNTDEFMPHEDYGVDEIMIHPQYRSNNLFNDIAVVRLDRQVVFKPHIDTACLPQDDDDFTGQECVATGWGTDAYQQGQFSLIMKEITLPVISNSDCQNLLRKTRLGQRFKLYGGFMCAGGKAGQDACKGDGGGPLVCFRSDNSYTVAGLVSWGIDCGQEGIPGVYVNVKKYNDWIISKTQRPIESYWSSQSR